MGLMLFEQVKRHLKMGNNTGVFQSISDKSIWHNSVVAPAENVHGVNPGQEKKLWGTAKNKNNIFHLFFHVFIEDDSIHLYDNTHMTLSAPSIFQVRP